MPAHLSIATALDLNRLASDVVYLILLEVDIIDPNSGAVAGTIYAVNNDESFTLDGQLYLPIPFELQIINDIQQSPVCHLVVYDLGQIFQQQLQQFGWSLAWPARIKIIQNSNPSGVVDLQQDFELLSAVAKADQYSITFEIGAENPLTLRFPPRQQMRNRCFWKYKGPECLYNGANPSCDFTLTGTNGCQVHNNVQNYGGFPGISITPQGNVSGG